MWIPKKAGVAAAEQFHKEALEPGNDTTLFVMVCDEAHWGFNNGGELLYSVVCEARWFTFGAQACMRR